MCCVFLSKLIAEPARPVSALSPLLFALSLVAFLVAIRRDLTICVQKLPGPGTFIVSTYVDNVTFYARDAPSLRRVL